MNNENKIQEIFNINERFDFASKLTTMVANGIGNGLIITGEGGLGKTYTTMKAIKNVGCGYIKIGGFSTARGLYNMLYDYNGELFLFDDCDSILDDKIARDLLKNALDSNNPRTLTWSAKMTKKDQEEYPQSFEFTGRIIFISNKPQDKIFQPLLTRGFKVDLTMNISEKIERMENILGKVCEENNFSYEVGKMAFDFIKENKNEIKVLSMRVILDVMKIIKFEKENWKNLAKYTITN